MTTIPEIRARSIADDDAHLNGLADQSCKDRATLLTHLDAMAGALKAFAKEAENWRTMIPERSIWTVIGNPNKSSFVVGDLFRAAKVLKQAGYDI